MARNYKPYEQGEPFHHNSNSAFSDIYHLKNHPDFLAKQLIFQYHLLIPKFKTLEEFRQYIEGNISLIKKYVGNYIPEHYLSYGGPDTEIAEDKEAYIFMKEVKPLELKDMKEKMEFYQQLDDFIEQSGQCFLDNFNTISKKGVAPDLSNVNFLYGQIGTQDPQLYYVDLFPILARSVNDVIERINKIIEPKHMEYNFPKTLNMLQKISQLKQ